MTDRAEGERLATLEEQVRGMRYDFNSLRDEMKQTMGTFLQHVTSMQRDYISRVDLERELDHRDQKERERMERIGVLEDEVERLKGRPTWTVAGVFTGAVAVIAILVSIIVVFLNGG